MCSQKERNTGCSAANVVGSAPTIVFSLPSSAAAGVRVSGASTNLVPTLANAARTFAAASTSLVVESMTTSPGRAAERIPSSPKTTEFTSGAPVTQIKTTSDARATAAGVDASRAPPAIRSAILSRGRDGRTYIVTGNPLSKRCFVMPCPISPDEPMKPMRGRPDDAAAWRRVVSAFAQRASSAVSLRSSGPPVPKARSTVAGVV